MRQIVSYKREHTVTHSESEVQHWLPWSEWDSLRLFTSDLYIMTRGQSWKSPPQRHPRPGTKYKWQRPCLSLGKSLAGSKNRRLWACTKKGGGESMGVYPTEAVRRVQTAEPCGTNPYGVGFLFPCKRQCCGVLCRDVAWFMTSREELGCSEERGC